MATDFEYEKKRNSLLRFASRTANEEAGKDPTTGDHDEWANKWSRIFLKEMDKLWADRNEQDTEGL